MMFFNKNTYGSFLTSEEKIATNILASRLQGLEENGIVKKLGHPESKAKVLYTLTQKGIDLLPILLEIHFWADNYFSVPAEIKARIEEAKKDKPGFISAMTNELKERAAIEQGNR
jgi:DNA-binding HxlR family transcriptional regulator